MRSTVLAAVLLVSGCTSAANISAEPPAAPDDVESIVIRPAADAGISTFCSERPEVATREPIVVSPSTLSLRVGESVSLLAFSTTSAETAAAVPTMTSVDSPAAQIRDGSVYALAPGTVNLEFRPLCAYMEDAPETVAVTVVELVISE